MPDDDDVSIEYSPLSGDVCRDGITLQVQIYRIAGSKDGWSLEVTDHTGASTVWQGTFATPEDAYREFSRTLESEGPAGFLGDDLSARKLN